MSVAMNMNRISGYVLYFARFVRPPFWKIKRKNKAKLTPLILALALVSGNAFCRDPNPPEVQALIGMRTPDEPSYVGPGWRPGSIGDVIPKWSCFGGLGRGEFTVEACYHRDGIAAIVAMYRVSRSSGFYTVVDAVVLPFGIILLPFDVRQKFGWDARMRRDHQRQYIYSVTCFTEKKLDVEPVIVALVRPESEEMRTCTHFTRRIKQAWQLNKKARRLDPISSKGVFCTWQACLQENTCEDEDRCNIP